MTDDAAGFEPDAGLVPTEAKIARREMLRQLLRSKTFIVGDVDRRLLGVLGALRARG